MFNLHFLSLLFSLISAFSDVLSDLIMLGFIFLTVFFDLNGFNLAF